MPPPYPPAPDGQCLYALGDVHGRLDCLVKAQALIDRNIALNPGLLHEEIYLGDLIDRGPHSRGVIDNLIQRASTHHLRLLRGNHEIQLDAYLSGDYPWEDFKRFGGAETLLSYGVDPRLIRLGGESLRHAARAAIPDFHHAFLAQASPCLQRGDYVFVHAGLRPRVPLAQQRLEDMAWIRGAFLDYDGDFGSIVVHGHTPVASVEFRPNRINLDTGAYMTNRLSVLRIDAAGPMVLE
jgi:serine/threonine protein phosphatase 1